MTSENNSPIAILEVVPASRVFQSAQYAEDPDATISYGRPCAIPMSSSPFRIGRGDGNQVLVQDNGMSRNSVSIIHNKGQLELEDLGQKQGVQVNGTQVDGRHVLEFDDVITFPNADVRITLKKAAEPDATEEEEPPAD